MTARPLIEPQRIQENALRDKEDNLHGQRFLQVRRLPVYHKRRMREYQKNDSYAEIARIVEHQRIAARSHHALVVMANLADNRCQQKRNCHKEQQTPDNMKTRTRELRRIDIRKQERRHNQEENHLRHRFDVHMELLIEKIPYTHEKKQRQHRVHHDIKKNHRNT